MCISGSWSRDSTGKNGDGEMGMREKGRWPTEITSTKPSYGQWFGLGECYGMQWVCGDQQGNKTYFHKPTQHDHQSHESHY